MTSDSKQRSHSEFLNQFQSQAVIPNNLSSFLCDLSCVDLHTKSLLLFMQYFGVGSITAFLFLEPLFKILLADNCNYNQSNGTVQVFATAQRFVMQRKINMALSFQPSSFISAKEW